MSTVDRVAGVVAELEELIRSGRLSPGDRLPAEREISARLGVSRSVVREAISHLASLGLVHSRHGSGTRVAEPSGRQVSVGLERLLSHADFRPEALAEVRLPLETAIAALAARKRTAQHLEQLAASQKVLGNARRTLEAHVQADLEFHATLAAATGNSLFRIVLAPIQEVQIESRRRTLGKYGSKIAFEHHEQILAAVRKGDATAASAAMRMHLETNFQHLAADAPAGDATAADSPAPMVDAVPASRSAPLKKRGRSR